MDLIESWVFVPVTKDFEIIVSNIVDGLDSITDSAFDSGACIYGIQTFNSEPPFIVPVRMSENAYELMDAASADRLSVYQGFAISSTGWAWNMTDGKEEKKRILIIIYKDNEQLQNAVVFQEGEKYLSSTDEGVGEGELMDAILAFDKMRIILRNKELQKGCND